MRTNIAVIRLTVCLTAIFMVVQSFALRADDGMTAGIAKSRSVATNGNPSVQLSPRETVSGIGCRPGRLLVRFTVGVRAVSRARILAQMGGATVEREYTIVPGLCLVKTGAGQTVKSALADWNGLSGVVYAEPDYEVKADLTPNDARFGELWGMHNTGQTGGTPGADIDAPEAWDVQTGSRSTVVAVIDTGVDYNHEDLAANMWRNTGEIPENGIDDDGNGYIDDVYGINAITGSGNPMDDHDHGTHCAGTIGGVGNNGVGVAGVCWNVQIMALKFLDASGSGWSSDAITCIEYAIRMHAKVLSNSWGGGGYDQSLKDAIDAAGAADIVFCAAAGNSALDTDVWPFYPSGYSSANIIAVMATDADDLIAWFSNYGRTTVDLAAPGVDILSCKRGGGYASHSGTSMAAPHVAGACGLLLSHNPGLTVAQIVDALLSTVDVPATPLVCVSSGRMNVARALAQMLTPPSAPTGVSASDGTFTDKVRVTWNASSGASYYHVYRNTVNDSGTATALGFDSASTTCDDTTATAGVTYYYWVKAGNMSGESGFSTPDTGSRSGGGGQAPSAPTGVTASDGTYTDKVRITWTASSGALYYHVYRNTVNDSGTATALGHDSASTTCDDTTATAGVTYYYWVKAGNTSGESGFSSSDSGSRRMPTPGEVAFSASTYTVNESAVSVTLTVTRSLGSDGAASVNYATQDGTAIAGIDYTAASETLAWSDGDSASKTITVTVINRSGKQDNRAFTVWLSGASGVALASPSSASVTIVDRSPTLPLGVMASDGTYSDKVMVYWTSVSVATSYKVWRGTNNNSQNVSVLGTATTSLYLDTTVNADSVYYYWIQAVNEAGTSDLSASDSGYCGSIADPAIPAGVSASDGLYTNQISVTWQAVSGTAQYEVWRATETNISAATLIKETTGTSYNDTSSNQGVCYYYWVRARDVNNRYSDYGTQDSGWCRLSSPGSVSASNGTYLYRIQVTWTPVVNAAWYEVWREEVSGANSDGGNLCKVAQTSETYFNDYQTKSGVYYRYKVKAFNGLCSSLDSGHDTGVRQVNAASRVLPPVNDYDGDKLSDLALFNSSSGVFDVLCSALGRQTFTFNAQNSQGATGDLDGDRKADPLVYCPYSGTWLTMFSNMGYVPIVEASFGAKGNVGMTAAADYDGDGLADMGVYNGTNGVLSVMLSNGGAFDIRASCFMGGSGYSFISADFDGDGLADPTVYSESEGSVISLFSGSEYVSTIVALGGPGKGMYAADFDGDGKSDPVLYEKAAGTWTVLLSGVGYSAVRISFGGADYAPAIGDYDGDGKADPAVYLPAAPSAQPMQAGQETTGQWLIMLSGSGYAVIGETFGAVDLKPVGR